MSTISSPGVTSGLDVNSIVTQLVALERRPIEQLQAQASTIQTKLSSFGLLQSYATNLRDISAQLAKPSFWQQTVATSADPTSVAVTSTATAAAGSYAVQVTQLAQSQSIASAAFASGDTVVGTGTLRIELGTWDAGFTGFTANPAKTAVDIPISVPDNTVEAIKTKINAANAGVTASVLRDATGARLVIRSNDTGSVSMVRLSVTNDGDTDDTNAAGLSGLAFNPPAAALGAAANQMTQKQAGLDATATINGLAVSAYSNQLTDVIDGVTLNLSKTTTAAVGVTVGLDTTAQRKAVNDFAKAYSEMSQYIAQQTKYDASNKKAAALQGDSSTLSLQSTLRNAITGSSTASSVFSRLSDIGLEMQTDGTLKVNDTKLSSALQKPTELAKLFNATANESAAQGFGVRFKTLGDQLVSSDGLISSRTKGLRERVTRNEAEQQRYEARVSMIQQRLLKQYTALDVQLGRIKGEQSALTQSLQALTANNQSS